MDDLVLRGMARWPNVPAVYGWLALDRRGQWSIRGERIGNPVVREFIGRNYGHDEEGRWFFQNGPQRVFVSLEYTPLVYRVVNPPGATLALEAHTGVAATGVRGAWIDEDGSVLVETGIGVGLVHDADLEALSRHLVDSAGATLADEAISERIERMGAGLGAELCLRVDDHVLPAAAIASAEVPRRFGFVAAPQAPEGAETCA